MKLSAIILTKNEEKNILDCIESLKGVEEIVIVDDNSSDRTVEIIKGLDDKRAKIFKRDLNSDFSSQRNFGLSKAKHDWIMFIDADERAGEELINEIKRRIIFSDACAYRVRRADVIWGKKLKFGETGNIRPIRFIKKGSGKFRGKVHEVILVNGKVEDLRGEILHYPHQTVSEFIREINNYSSIRANELKEQGAYSSVFSIIAHTKGKFFLNYIIKLGFLDGTAGFIHASIMSFHSFLVRSKLWLLMRN